MRYPDEWQPGEPWPTDDEFAEAGYVKWSAQSGTVTFEGCWTRDDTPLGNAETPRSPRSI